MKSINIRKVAAVAAGTALLAGAAFAATGVTGDFLVDDNGDCNVQIVVGQDAAISDGIAAGSLAAAIGAKCYVETEGGESVTVEGADIGATGSVTVNTGTTTVVGSGDTLEVKPYDNEDSIYEGNNNAIWTLTKANAPFLKSGKLTFTSGTDYNYQEMIGIGTSGQGFKVKYQEDKDQHGVILTASSGSTIDYYVNFDTAAPDQTTINGAPELYFLGTKYIVNKWDIGGGKITLIKGVEARLGVGQSTDVTVGDSVYTVTLDDASLDEANSIGEATVSIGVDGDSTTVNLDTSSSPDSTWNDFYVYLQSVAKSYTPGQGGTATLRVGGEKADLNDGAEYEADINYKVSFTKTTTGDNLMKLRLLLNDAIDLNDDLTTIEGPNGYFEIQYSGTSSETVDTITVETSSYRINKVTYPDKEGTVIEASIQDSNDKIETYFTERGNETHANNTLIINNGKYFVSDDEVIKYQSFDADPDTSYTTSSVSVTLKPYGEDASTFYPTNIVSNAVACFNDKVVAGRTIDFMMAIKNDTVDATYYNKVNDSTCAVFSGVHPVDPSYPDIKKGHISVDTNNDGLIDGLMALNTNVFANITAIPIGYALDATNGGHEQYGGIGLNVTVWEPVGTGFGKFNITGTNTSASEGMKVLYTQTAGPIATGAATTAYGTNSGDDNKRYHMSNWGTIVDSTTSDTTLTIPKNSLKLNMFAGQPTGTSTEGMSIYTPDSFADPVTAFTCVADDYAYTSAAGVNFGEWTSPVVDDKSVPIGNAIVVGGHLVNKLAVGVTDSKLTKAGDSYCELVGNTLYCAGYTAADTTGAVNSLVSEIKAL